MSALPIRRLVLATAVIAVAIVLLAVYFVPFHRPVESSDCRTLTVAARVPSVAMDQERGIAYLAYVDRAQRSSGRAPRATIMLMDMSLKEPSVRAALVTNPAEFQPIALGLYAPREGARRLFVIDRGTGSTSSVRIFEQSASGAFELVKTAANAFPANASAIWASGPETFHAGSESRAGLFERLFGEPPSFVNEKTRKRLEVRERDEATDLLVCPMVGGPQSPGGLERNSSSKPPGVCGPPQPGAIQTQAQMKPAPAGGPVPGPPAGAH